MFAWWERRERSCRASSTTSLFFRHHFLHIWFSCFHKVHIINTSDALVDASESLVKIIAAVPCDGIIFRGNKLVSLEKSTICVILRWEFQWVLSFWHNKTFECYCHGLQWECRSICWNVEFCFDIFKISFKAPLVPTCQQNNCQKQHLNIERLDTIHRAIGNHHEITINWNST